MGLCLFIGAKVICFHFWYCSRGLSATAGTEDSWKLCAELVRTAGKDNSDKAPELGKLYFHSWIWGRGKPGGNEKRIL